MVFTFGCYMVQCMYTFDWGGFLRFMRAFSITLCLFILLMALSACGDTVDGGSSAVSDVSPDGSVPSENITSTESTASVESTVSSDATSSDSASGGSDNTANLQKLTEIGGKAVLYKVNDNIFKLEVPFSGIYTSVFFVKVDGGYVTVDTGSNANDVNNYVVPAMGELGITLDSIKGILLTHTHGDHAGGLAALAPLCPNAVVYGVRDSNASAGSNAYVGVSDGDVIADIIKVVTIKGHDTDTCGYLDTRSKTLISGDSIQIHGIASWGCQVRHIDDYFASMRKLQEMDIENILISHAYCPSGAFAFGAEASQKYISDSIDALEVLMTFTEGLYSTGVTDAGEIQSQYVALMKETYPDFPKSGFDTAIKAIITQKLK